MLGTVSAFLVRRQRVMSRRSLILFIWLAIGAAAAGQRGYYTDLPSTCSAGATIAVTITTGPLNYLGVNPQITCNWPTPSSS
jgi:hypothetical protein